MGIENDIQKLLLHITNVEGKICFPATKKNRDYFISENLNSASHYCIVDFKEKNSSILSIEEINEIFLIEKNKGFQALGISDIICKNITPIALKILEDSNISVWKPEGTNIPDNMYLFQVKKLSRLKQTDSLLSKSCSTTTCSSCSSSCS